MTERKTWVLLLIEDNPGDARLIRELLNEAGSGSFRVECADTLANGLTSVDNLSFDVVVLDLSLPDSDGLATFSALHAHSPQLPVIVLTGHDDDLLAIAAVRAGAQDYLVKGKVTGDMLARSIHYAIERKRVADTLRENSLFTAMLLQTSPLGMDIVDEAGRLLFVSPSFQAVLGREAVGETCWQLYKDDGQQCTDCPLKQGIEPGVTKSVETSGVLGEREFEISHTGMVYQGKKALLEVFHDITERKRAERRSQLANQVLDLLNRPVGETDTIHDLLGLVKESTGLEAAGIRLREGEDYPYHQASGFPDDFLASERSLCARDESGALLRDDQGEAVLECWCGAVLSERTDPTLPCFTKLGSYWTNSTTDLLASTTEKERLSRTRNRCNSEGYESVALIPLRSGSKVIGLLQLNDRRRDRFTAKTIRFFEGLGSSIGIALNRKRMGETLRESEERFRSILDNIEDGCFEVDTTGNFTFFNPALVRMLGRPADELMGMNYRLYMTPEGAKAVFQAFNRIFRTGIPEQAVDWGLVRPDGTPRSVEASVSPIKAADGSIQGFRGTVRDVTERKRAEEARQRAEQRYRALFEEAPAMYIVTRDVGGAPVIADCNDLVCRTLGFSHDELLGQPLADFYTPASRAQLLAGGGYQRAMAGESVDEERELVTRDGRIVPSVVRAVPETDAAGQISGTRAMYVDITERKRAEAALRQRVAELVALQRVSAALRSTVSLQEMLDMLLDETLAVIGTDAGGIWLYDAASDELRPAAVRGWFAGIRYRVLAPGEGIVGASFAEGQIIVSREFKADPRTLPPAREQMPAGWGGACVPLHTADTVVGVLFCSVELPRELGARELGLLNTLAAMGGNAIHRESLHDQTERQLVEAEALRQVDRAVASNFDLTVTLGLAVRRAGELLGADAATVMLPNAYELRYAAWDGIRSQEVGKTRIRITGSCAGRAITERRLITVDDVAEKTMAGALPRFYSEEGFTTYYAMPIIAKGAVKGVLEVLNRSRLSTTPHWLDLLTTLAGQAAVAIDNADLFEGLQRSNADLTVAYDATIEGWSRALDLRDKETEGHSQRVTEVTVRLAALMGAADADLVHIRRGALLHDIGKLGVPDQILLKPGKLTDDEWTIMHQHPQMAYDLLSSIPYLRPALDIPISHHEKWDGTGYPRGLQGTDIPLAARLFAVADVADALGSDRPYRPAWPAKRIQDYLREQSGLHFEPQVVAMFLAMDTV